MGRHFKKTIIMKRTFLLISFMLCAVFASAQNESSENKAAAEAVDLGLPSGTLWASCNIGATKPEEFGDYFAWGETETRESFKREEYLHIKPGQENVMAIRRVFTDLGKDIAGTEYDVAHVKWGGQWVMPSLGQFAELEQNCNWEWTELNGVNGYKITSKKNGNSIFLPAAGSKASQRTSNIGVYGLYWSCTIGYSGPSDACNLMIEQGSDRRRQTSLRSMGYTVRAVCK